MSGSSGTKVGYQEQSLPTDSLTMNGHEFTRIKGRLNSSCAEGAMEISPRLVARAGTTKLSRKARNHHFLAEASDETCGFEDGNRL